MHIVEYLGSRRTHKEELIHFDSILMYTLHLSPSFPTTFKSAHYHVLPVLIQSTLSLPVSVPPPTAQLQTGLPDSCFLPFHLTFSRTLPPKSSVPRGPLVSPLTLSAVFPVSTPPLTSSLPLCPAGVPCVINRTRSHPPSTPLPFPQSSSWGRIQALVNPICPLTPMFVLEFLVKAGVKIHMLQTVLI